MNWRAVECQLRKPNYSVGGSIWGFGVFNSSLLKALELVLRKVIGQLISGQPDRVRRRTSRPPFWQVLQNIFLSVCQQPLCAWCCRKGFSWNCYSWQLLKISARLTLCTLKDVLVNYLVECSPLSSITSIFAMLQKLRISLCTFFIQN